MRHAWQPSGAYTHVRLIAVAHCLAYSSLALACARSDLGQCTSPDSLWSVAPQRFDAPSDVPLRAGRYRLTMVAAVDSTQQLTAVGSLELWTAPPDRRHPPNRSITYFLQGASDIDLARVGSPSVAYPVSSRAPDSAGVELSYDAESGTVEAWLGNSYSPALMRMDQGTVLLILTADSTRVRGRWRSGGRRPWPSGYFCVDALPLRSPSRGA